MVEFIFTPASHTPSPLDRVAQTLDRDPWDQRDANQREEKETLAEK
jgi:hypothetical protein